MTRVRSEVCVIPTVSKGPFGGTRNIFVDVEVDFADQDNFLFAYIHDLESTGIFVRTTCPEAPGTKLRVRFRPAGTDAPLQLDGQVIWVNPYRPDDSDNLSPGMGIRFLDLTTEQRSQLIDLIKRLAYLDSDGESLDGDSDRLEVSAKTSATS